MEKINLPDNIVKMENKENKKSVSIVEGKIKKDGVLQAFLRSIYRKNLINSEGFIEKESLRDQFQDFVAKNHLVRFNNQGMLVFSLKRNGFIVSETGKGYKIDVEKFLQPSEIIPVNVNSSLELIKGKEIGEHVLQRYLRYLHKTKLLDEEGYIRKQLLTQKFHEFAAKDQSIKCNNPDVLINSLIRNGFILLETKRRFLIHKEKFLETPDNTKEKENLETEFSTFDESFEEEMTSKLLRKMREYKDMVDPKSPIYELTFQKGNIQYVKPDFSLTSTSCCICQQSFSLQSKFDDHLKWHGKKLDFPLIGECESRDQVFKVSYKHCLDSYFLQFTLESIKDVCVQKIAIVRPEVQKSINYVNNGEVPFLLKSGTTKEFLVNCFLFNIGEKQPFVIIYKRDSDGSEIRRLEQHLFLRMNEFPKCSMKLISTRVPERGELQLKKRIKPSFPNRQIRKLSKVNYREEDIMKENVVMGQYLLEGKLKPHNFENVLSFLLQMEDHFILSDYSRLTQSNKAISRYGDEYSVTIKKEEIRGTVRVGEIAAPFDDIVVSYLTDNNAACDNFGEYFDDDIYDDTYGWERTSHNRRKENKRKCFHGMIHKIDGDTVFFIIRLNKKLPERSGYDIQILPQRISIRYQHNALEKVAENRNIRSLLFPTINFNRSLANIRLELYNKSIESNPEQLQAVMNIADGPNPAAPYIIFGPPGTGKTTTVVESAYQLWKIKPSSRILVTAGSNAACDEVARRLCRIFEDVDREGMNLLRIYAASAECRIDNTEEILVEASNFAHGHHFYPSLESIYLYRIVVVTLTVAGKLVQGNIAPTHFTHIFIDECAASTEPEAMTGIVGLLSSKARLILSGDPKQLGPVLKSPYAEELGLGISMMERLLKEKCYEVDPKTGEYDRSIQTRLRRNFRTHPDILCLSNELYYNNELIPSAKKELTHWALGWHKLPAKRFPIIFHAVRGCTKRDVGQTSLKNHEEIDMVMQYVYYLMKSGVNGRKIKEEDIGIISPYKRQCDLIREKIDALRWFQIEVGSVEIFQGKEKPIIIISTVRSDTPGVGFLDSPKRLNVTLTRAQALMIIIGNPDTLQMVSDWRKVIEYCHKNKAITGMKFTFECDLRREFNQLPNVPQVFLNTSTPKGVMYENYYNKHFPELKPTKSPVKLESKELKFTTPPNVEKKSTKMEVTSKTKVESATCTAQVNKNIATISKTSLQSGSNAQFVSKSTRDGSDLALERLTCDMNKLKIGTPKNTRSTNDKSTKTTQLTRKTIDFENLDVIVTKDKDKITTKNEISPEELKSFFQQVLDTSSQEPAIKLVAYRNTSEHIIEEKSVSSESNERIEEIKLPTPPNTAHKSATTIQVNKNVAAVAETSWQSGSNAQFVSNSTKNVSEPALERLSCDTNLLKFDFDAQKNTPSTNDQSAKATQLPTKPVDFEKASSCNLDVLGGGAQDKSKIETTEDMKSFFQHVLDTSLQEAVVKSVVYKNNSEHIIEKKPASESNEKIRDVKLPLSPSTANKSLSDISALKLSCHETQKETGTIQKSSNSNHKLYLSEHADLPTQIVRPIQRDYLLPRTSVPDDFLQYTRSRVTPYDPHLSAAEKSTKTKKTNSKNSSCTLS